MAGSYAAAGHLRPWGIKGDLVSVEPGTEPTFRPSDYSADNMWALRNKALLLVGTPPPSVMPDADEQTVRAGLREYLGDVGAFAGTSVEGALAKKKGKPRNPDGKRD